MKKFTEKVLSVNRSSFDEKYKDTIIFFKNELSENFIEPHKVLCDLNDCYFVEKNGSNYSDLNHLSYFGAMKMKNILSTIFQK